MRAPLVWPGPKIDDIPFANARISKLKAVWTNGRTTHATGVQLRYGNVGEPRRARDWVLIDETLLEDTIGVDDGGDPLPRAGAIALTGSIDVSTGAATLWSGKLRHGRLLVHLMSPRRDLIIAAARALQQVGP